MEWKCMSCSRVSNCWGYCSRPKWRTRNERVEGTGDREWGSVQTMQNPGVRRGQSQGGRSLFHGTRDQRSALWVLQSETVSLRVRESLRRLCISLLKVASKIQLKNWNGRSQSRKGEVNVRKMGKKETNITDFSIMPFLPATGVEKEGKKVKGKPLAEKDTII